MSSALPTEYLQAEADLKKAKVRVVFLYHVSQLLSPVKGSSNKSEQNEGYWRPHKPEKQSDTADHSRG